MDTVHDEQSTVAETPTPSTSNIDKTNDRNSKNNSDAKTNSEVKNKAKTPNQEKPRKPFALFFEIRGNLKQTLQQIHTLCPKSDTELVNKQIKISTDDLESFRILQKFLNDSKIPARSIDTKSERPKKFIARGLPSNTDIADIEYALNELGIECIKIAFLTNRETKQPMPLFLITAKPSPNLEKIHNIRTINYLRVSFEPYSQTGTPQCYRCQKFFHSSLTCNLTPKCLKCSLPHKSSECKASRENFKCANCGGNHTANYKGCPAHPKNKTKEQPKETSEKSSYSPAPNPKENSWIKNSKTTPKTTPSPPKTSTTSQQPILSTSNSTEVKNTIQNIPTPQNKPQPPKNNSKKTPNKTNANNQVNNSKTTEKTQSTTSKTSSDSTESVSSIGDSFRTIVQFMKEFNLTDIMNLFKEISKAFKTDQDPIQKLLAAFELIANYFDTHEISDG